MQETWNPVKKIKPRELSCAYGLGPSNGCNIIARENELQNVLSGMIERLCFVPGKKGGKLLILDKQVVELPGPGGETIFRTIYNMPELNYPIIPNNGVWQTHDYFSKMIIDRTGPGIRDPHDVFAEKRPAQKRELYRQAVTDLKVRSLTREDSFPHAFVKLEKQIDESNGPGTQLDDENPAIARIIQASSPKYNVCLGSFVSTMEESIYNAIDDIYPGRKTVMKGQNATQIAQTFVEAWDEVSMKMTDYRLVNMGDDSVIVLRFKKKNGTTFVRAVSIDISRFDQHVHLDTVLHKHKFYLELFKHHPEVSELRELLDWQAHYHVHAFVRSQETGLSYKVTFPNRTGKVRSGDMDTSLAAVFIITSCLHNFLSNYKPMLYDDFIVQMKEHFKIHGLPSKLEGKADCLEEIQFCQTSPIWTGKRWIMVPLLNSLTKHAIGLCEVKKHMERLVQIGIAGRHAWNDIPIFGAYYRAFPSEADLPKRLGTKRWSDQSWTWSGISYQTGLHRADVDTIRRAGGSVTDDARISFWKSTGVEPYQQRIFEELFENLKFDQENFTSWEAPWKVV